MKKGYLYIVLAAVIFSTMEIAGKIILKDLNPIQLTFLRFLSGGVFLLPFAIRDIKKKKICIEKNDIAYFFLTGFLCVVISMTFFHLAIEYTKASSVAILFSTKPVFTIPFAYLILKEDLTKNTILSLLISFIGIVCILNPFNISPDIAGFVFAVLAAVFFSLFSVVGKKRSAKYGSFTLNAFTFLCGDLILLIFILLTHIEKISYFNIKNGVPIFSNIPIFYGVNMNNILYIIYLGVVVTGIGYIFFFKAMEETSASTGAITFFIKPALAPIFSLIVLKESIPINTILGIIFIIAGSFITFKDNNKNVAKVELDN